METIAAFVRSCGDKVAYPEKSLARRVVRKWRRAEGYSGLHVYRCDHAPADRPHYHIGHRWRDWREQEREVERMVSMAEALSAQQNGTVAIPDLYAAVAAVAVGPPPTLRVCKVCGEPKDTSQFIHYKSGALHTWCFACLTANMNARKQERRATATVAVAAPPPFPCPAVRRRNCWLWRRTWRPLSRSGICSGANARRCGRTLTWIG